MMTATELREMVGNGENSGVEFKRDSIDARALAKELVAFANFEGGTVLLGVEDDGSVSGTNRADVEQWVVSACRDKIRPEIIPYFESVEMDGKRVAVVRVARGFAVHHVWHDSHRTYYIRVASHSREASPEELSRLFQQRTSLRAELQPVAGSGLAGLDQRRLREYFATIRQQDAPEIGDDAAWRVLLANTDLLTDEGNQATMAGMLLFGRDPDRALPQSGIDAVAYRGTEPDYDSFERAAIRGPLVRLGPVGNLVENGLVEGAMQFLQRHASREVLSDHGQRVRVWDYPPEVVREGVVNALVHRDYLLSGTTVEMSLYADRLELVSPGRLHNGVNPERMRIGCRSARNPLLKDVLRDYGYMEHMGMGIPRKIIRGMREHNGTEPDLVADHEGERFTLRLWRRGSGPN
jgi:ATP-dependent DNA helicase RecG